MSEVIIEFFKTLLPPEGMIVAISAMPVVELRLAIPVGIVMGMIPLKVFFLSIIGNLIPVLPLLYMLEPLSNKLRKIGIFKKFFDWLFERTKKRAKLVEKYELLGLIALVAIPLPMTGAWTGCMAASLFGLDKKLSFFAVTVGVLIAGVIVSIITLGVRGIF
ncbi:MAG: small multi-drug export protein [PVC group bacterium]|nr:small multi-drug export protein [PVC group bacterium]